MELASRLEQIWLERFNQKIEAVTIAFAALKSELQIAPQGQCVDSLHLIEVVGAQNFVTMCSIEASLLRAQKKMAQSVLLLESIEQKSPVKAVLESFYFHFEKGLSKFVQSNWSEAIEYFLRAYTVARTDFQKTACLLNLVLNYENLGLPSARTKEELKANLIRLEQSSRWGVESQLEAFNLRNAWSSGELLKSGLSLSRDSVETLSQTTYFTAYISSLPYARNLHGTSGSTERLASLPGNLINRGYRLRTLSGQLSSDDAAEARLSDRVERVYLWIWK